MGSHYHNIIHEGIPMFVYILILILILFLSLAFLSSAVECLFSEDELCEMGIRFEYPLASDLS